MLDEGDEAEVQKPVVDTYDTLVEKRKNLESSIETTEKQIKDAVEALNEAKKIQQINSFFCRVLGPIDPFLGSF